MVDIQIYNSIMYVHQLKEIIMSTVAEVITMLTAVTDIDNMDVSAGGYPIINVYGNKNTITIEVASKRTVVGDGTVNKATLAAMLRVAGDMNPTATEVVYACYDDDDYYASDSNLIVQLDATTKRVRIL